MLVHQADTKTTQRPPAGERKGFPAVKGRTSKKSQQVHRQVAKKKRAARDGGLPPVIGLEDAVGPEDGAFPDASLDDHLADSASIQWDVRRPSEGDSLDLKCEGLSSSGKVSFSRFTWARSFCAFGANS